MNSQYLDANPIVKLAFETNFESESTDAQVIRRILRRKIETVLSNSSNAKIVLNFYGLNDLERITKQLQKEIEKNPMLLEEFNEITGLLKREEEKRFEIRDLSLFAAAATAITTSLLSGIPTGIVAASVVPLLLKLAEWIRRKNRTELVLK